MVTKSVPVKKRKAKAAVRSSRPDAAPAEAEIDTLSPRGSAARVAGKLLDTPRAMVNASLRAVLPASKPTKQQGSTWGFASLEEVFDQRIASAMARLGVPTVQRVEALEARLDQVIKRLDALSQKQKR